MDERIRNLKSNLDNTLGSYQFINQEINLIYQFVHSFVHLYQYERKINEDGDEIIDTLDTPHIQISINSEQVRLKNPDSYHIKIVPFDDMKKLKKIFTVRSRYGINLSAMDLESQRQWLNDNIINNYLNLLIIGLNKSCFLFNTILWLEINFFV